MRRTTSTLLLIALGLLALPNTAAAGNYIIYYQGRGWGSWSGEKVTSPGWTNLTYNFNGNAKINGNETNVTVKNSISTYCANGNSCYLVCYSAGCLRMLKAIDDLRASGVSLPGIVWAEGAASAAGGTKLAEVSTKGFTGFLAKLLGQQEQVDYDMTPSAARSTWGYVQDAMAPNTLWHTGGKNNICKTIIFWKICGNTYVNAGVGDGVVGLDSSSGAAAAGATYDGCAVAKYPGRAWEPGRPCGGEDRDHFGMVGRTVAIIGPQIAQGFGNDQGLKWDDSPGYADCNDTSGECDKEFSVATADYSKTLAGAGIAADVSAVTSPTTGSTVAGSCGGKCGKYAGGCYCDSVCTSYGDCCADYTAMRCDVFNAQ